MREILIKAFTILSILAFLTCNFQTENKSVKPSVTNITESVYASVTVRPRKTYYPQPLRSGIIQNIYVEEGDIIDQGDKLFDISATEEVRSNLENAELNLEEARFNYQGENNMLLNMKAEIRSLKDQLSLDSINYERQKRLWSQNIGKKIDLDQSLLTYNTNKNKLKIVEQKLAQTKISLEKNYQISLNQVRAQKSLVQDYTVRTKMGGKVFSLFKEEGDLISSQERFAEIGTSNDFILEMNIDEVDITKINIGDTVAISLDAYANESFLASITEILPKKDEVTQTFRAEGTFINIPSRLYNGLSGEANIIIEKRNNALIIPTEYVLEGNKVLTPAGEKQIEIGIKNLEFTEVLNGLDTNITLLKPSEQ